MIGNFFDFFNSFAILNRKFIKYILQPDVLGLNTLLRFSTNFDYIVIKEQFEPLKLNFDPKSHKCVLRKVSSERVAGLGVAAIYWRDRSERGHLSNEF